MRQFAKILYLSSVLLAALNLFGQEKTLMFNHFRTDDGLSHNSVYAINQDTIGFIWIGTRSGLNRYDGNHFKIYGIKEGLKDIFINTIFRDSRGIIWIGTQEGGLSRYNYTSDDFTTWMLFPENEGIGRLNNVLSIAEDHQGSIWIGMHEGGLYRFSEEDQTLQNIRIEGEFSSTGHQLRINAIIFDSDSTAWLGTFHGLYRLHLSQGENPVSCQLERISETWTTCLYQDENKSIIAGTSSGIIFLDRQSENIEVLNTTNSGLPNNMITDIKTLSKDQLIMSSDGGGVCIYNKATRKFDNYQSDPNNPSSLSNNSVYEVFQSSDGVLWVGNYQGGLNYYYAEEWKFDLFRHKLNDLNSLSDNQARTFHEDYSGDIWIGTLGGLNRFNKTSGNFTLYLFDQLFSNSILSVNSLDENLLWIGTFGGGVNIFDKRTNSYSKLTHPDDLNNSLERASIYQIEKTAKGSIILTSLGGIYVLDSESGRMRRYTTQNSDLSSNTVKVTCIDHEGNIWLGTNFGLNMFNPRDTTFKVYKHSTTDPYSLANNRILSICESDDQKIWVGTEGGGVSIFNPETEQFTSLSTDQGLPDNVINAIIQDLSGDYWLTSNKGLIRYEKNSKTISVFTNADGLQGNEFYQNSSLLASDGTLYFGGPYGFNSVQPQNLQSNSRKPRVVLTDLYYSGKAVSIQDENSPIERQLYLTDVARFPYHSSFEIHYCVPGTPNSNKYTFSYLLEGAGHEWTDYQKTPYANFSNLKPGNYVFRVKAMTNSGITGEIPTSIRIRILPPWWKSWWAFIMYTFIIGISLMILLYLNNEKLKVRHALQNQVREKKQIEELNQMKLRFFTDISHEFKTPLTLILGYLDNLKGSAELTKNKTLTVIESNAKRLLTLINQLMEFRKAESGLMKLNATKGNLSALIRVIAESFSNLSDRKNISLKVICKEPFPEVWFDGEKIEKVIYNLLSNAFKYSDAGGRIEIELRTFAGNSTQADSALGTEHVQIFIRDSGLGIASDEIPKIFDRFYHNESLDKNGSRTDGSGIGLALSKRLVELHHGTISVNSNKGEGTEFVVQLPLGKDHLSDLEIKEDNQYSLRMDYSNLTPEEPDISEELENGQNIDNTMPIMLVVDDNRSVRQVISEKFQNSYTIITGSDGRDGIQKARQYLPDIIISDIMMPNLDGFEFCRLLKLNMSTSHIPIILLTAKSGEEDQIQGYSTGADAYIAKPYNPELLKATVLNLVTSRKLLQKKYIDQSDYVNTAVIENKLDEEFLQKLVKTIENEDFSEKLDVNSLCSELAMSRSVLYRKVKMLTDNSIQEFVRLVKLRKSARLLKSTSMSISELAATCGFINTKHFSTAFKKLYHQTPSEYRNS